MVIFWTYAGATMCGLYEPERRRWSWGGETWAMPWRKVGSA